MEVAEVDVEVDAEVVEEKEEEEEEEKEEERNNSDKIQQPSPGRWGKSIFLQCFAVFSPCLAYVSKPVPVQVR
jgi:CO dehydrogenase/acetyl-CoA synthase beta subunit